MLPPCTPNSMLHFLYFGSVSEQRKKQSFPHGDDVARCTNIEKGVEGDRPSTMTRNVFVKLKTQAVNTKHRFFSQTPGINPARATSVIIFM